MKTRVLSGVVCKKGVLSKEEDARGSAQILREELSEDRIRLTLQRISCWHPACR